MKGFVKENFFEILENYEDSDELMKQLIVVKCSLTDDDVEQILQNKSNISNQCAKDVYDSYFNRVTLDSVQTNEVKIVQEESIVEEENKEKGGGMSYVLIFIFFIFLIFYSLR